MAVSDAKGAKFGALGPRSETYWQRSDMNDVGTCGPVGNTYL